MLLLQADGASRGNPGEASYGALIIDQSGLVLAELSERIGVATNNEAEYRAVIAGLEFLEKHYPGRAVQIEMDSKLVVEQASGRWKIKSDGLKPLLQRVSMLCAARQVEFHWIPRERNYRADALANLALDGGASEVLPALKTVPASIRAPETSIAPTDLYLIRHGSTSDTAANLISGGDADPPLSSPGRLEASRTAAGIRQIARQFGLQLPQLLLHSPQKRATETAEIIAAQLGVDTRMVSDLREISFGKWEGMKQDELAKQPEAASWRGSLEIRPPGGESLRDLESRVLPVLDETLLGNPGAGIAIVSHMMPTRTMLIRLLKAGPEMYWGMNLKPASISAIRGFGHELIEAQTINYCAHLEAE